jgi:hypothetical protein
MPRFGTKSLLIVVALLALWLSTVNRHAVGSDIRNSIMLAIAVTSLLGVIYYGGQRRAFWTGFFITVLAVSVRASPFYPKLYWINNLMSAYGQDRDLPRGATNYVYVFYDETFRAFVTLLLATLMGYIGTRIYEHSHQTENQ